MYPLITEDINAFSVEIESFVLDLNGFQFYSSRRQHVTSYVSLLHRPN